MNVRLLLLVMMTGFFMTLWDGDQAAMQAALARRSQRSATMLADARPAGIPSQTVSQTIQTVSEISKTRIDGESLSVCQAGDQGQSECDGPGLCPHQPETLTAVRQVASAVVPMPVGLPAGEYQAVSESGETLRLTISQNSGSATGSESESGLVMSTTPEGIKWYFVRIHVPAGK